MNPLLVGKVQHDQYKWSLKIVLTGGYISNIIVDLLIDVKTEKLKLGGILVIFLFFSLIHFLFLFFFFLFFFSSVDSSPRLLVLLLSSSFYFFFSILHFFFSSPNERVERQWE
jgi:hypothetical protein